MNSIQTKKQHTTTVNTTLQHTVHPQPSAHIFNTHIHPTNNPKHAHKNNKKTQQSDTHTSTPPTTNQTQYK